MTREKPSREAVLAYMDETGCTAVDASKHYQGLRSPGTIRKWVSRRRVNRGEKPPPKRSKRGKRKGDNAPTDTDPRKPRGRRGKFGGAILDPEKLEAAAKKGIRDAVINRLNYLATLDSLDDPHQQKVAVTMGILIDKCPDILNLVDVPVAASTADDQLARIKRALLDAPGSSD